MTDREKFEAWYVENAFNLEACPIGSRECGLQRKAWAASRQQALEESAAEAESWKGGKLRFMAGELSGPELRIARGITTTIARVLRCRAETTGEQG